MPRSLPKALRLAAALVLASCPAGIACGKKAPLRLPEQRPTEKVSAIRASVRERQVVIAFRVPSRRIFPEREEPWVLARILRATGGGQEFAEVGTVLEAEGFPFESRLSWTDVERDPGVVATYRVEFHDARRRRRAVSQPLTISWAAVPGAPRALRAEGGEGSVALAWEAPEAAGADLRYRVYRRVDGGADTPLGEEPVAGLALVDSRIERGRENCYVVRAVLAGVAVEVEGPAGEERCARSEDATPPPAPAAPRVASVPGAFLLTWDAVAAADLAGYHVYRGIGEGNLVRITPSPLEGTAFRDEVRDLPSGTRCRWAITAVDGSERRNESAFSPFAELLVE